MNRERLVLLMNRNHRNESGTHVDWFTVTEICEYITKYLGYVSPQIVVNEVNVYNQRLNACTAAIEFRIYSGSTILGDTHTTRHALKTISDLQAKFDVIMHIQEIA